MRQSNIQKGSIAEGLFLAKCLELGWNVCLPITPTQFDMVLYDGSTFKRVQVKSASKVDTGSRGQRIKCMLVTGRHKGRRAYQIEDTDFIVLWASPTRDWYVFPIDVVAGKMSINLFPTVLNSKSRYEIYKNAFHLLHTNPAPSF